MAEIRHMKKELSQKLRNLLVETPAQSVNLRLAAVE